MAEVNKTEDKPNANLANQDEKNDPKAPAMSFQQVKMLNVSLQKQLNIAQTILLDIANTCNDQGLQLMNMSQNIKNLFKAPTAPQGQQPQGQGQPPQTQPAK